MKAAMLACMAVFVVGCGGDSGLPTQSVMWLFGTPTITAQYPSDFPLQAQLSVQVNRSQGSRIDPAPDGTNVTVRCVHREDGRVENPPGQVRDGAVEVELTFDHAEVVDVAITVSNATKEVTVEATVEAQVRLVGG